MNIYIFPAIPGPHTTPRSFKSINPTTSSPGNTHIWHPEVPHQGTQNEDKPKINWLLIGLVIFFVLLIIIIALLVWFKCFYKKRTRSITPTVGFSSQVNQAFEEPPSAAQRDMMKDNDLYVPACSVSTLARSTDKTKGNVVECMKDNDIYVSSDAVSTSLNNMSK